MEICGLGCNVPKEITDESDFLKAIPEQMPN